MVFLIVSLFCEKVDTGKAFFEKGPAKCILLLDEKTRK